MIERHGTRARSRPLSTALVAGEWFPVRRALAVALDLANELAALERGGTVHLGIEPRVIHLLPTGGARLGPPAGRRAAAGGATRLDRYARGYAAPERIEGRTDLDIRADLFSVGAVLFHMLDGAPAGPARSPAGPFRADPDGRAPPIRVWREELPVPFARAVRRCLRRDRTQRYASAHALMGALMEAAATLRR